MKIFISDLMGKPYEDLNCWQLVREVSERFGTTLPDYGDFSVECAATIPQAVAKHRHEYVRVENPEPGDVVCFKRMNNSFHVGIVIDSGYIFHSSPGTGASIIKMNHTYYRQIIEGYYRYVG